MTPFSMQLNRGPDGRIAEKTETVAGKTAAWAFAYDKAGRMTRASLDGRTVCEIGYDREGRRARDYFPHLDTSYRTFEYRTDDRLYRAGNNSYIHDENGFRSIWNHGGGYTLYRYAPDNRLLAAEWPEKSELTFTHDDQGRRAAKYRDGRLVEAYAWHDLIRLAGFFDGEREYGFAYQGGERTPYAMRRADGAVFALHFDQVGSLRVVADEDGNVIKEVQYDPFGSILADTNPALRIPIGFAGGLHDRDLGFVRFGWRDYDTFTSRWTAPDPMGEAGGDPDWYGYCLDDPVNGEDPLGLFRFGKRGLGGLPLLGIFSDNPIDDAANTELAHEHGFYEDGTGENVGLFKEGVRHDTENIHDYELEEKHYDDKRMRRAVDSLGDQEYNLLGICGKKNNCQDYADKMRSRYDVLNRGDRQR